MLFIPNLVYKPLSITNQNTMKTRKLLLSLMLIVFFSLSHAQSDTIIENFNGICALTETPGRTYIIDYTGANDVEWNIKTAYSSSSWWGGLDDDGSIIEGKVHCGSLQWDETSSGYARATLNKGIKTLSFQMRYGYQLVGGYIKVSVDGIEIARTETLEDKDVHDYTFEIDADGPLDLELVPVIETDLMGGIILDNIVIITTENTKPFFKVETLDGYRPSMHTLSSPLDTMQIYLYAEHCLEVNGEFADYVELTDGVSVTVGSIIDLIPGDSTNLYYWGTAVPGIGNQGGRSSVEVSLPVNEKTDSVSFDTSLGDSTFNGTLSFINGNIDLDLVLFRLKDAKNEYRINYIYNTTKPYTPDTTGSGVAVDLYNIEPAIKFYPNPIQNFAYFDTNKDLDFYEIFDINGKLVLLENSPQMSGDGHYRLNLENLESGVCFIRFRYMDNTVDAVKVMVQH